MEDAAVAYTTWLAESEPESLLLKVAQSAASNCPVLEMEENGKFMVKVFPEIFPLNIVPAVPVAKVVTTLEAEAKPKVEVDTKDRLPLPSSISKVLVAPWAVGKASGG